MKLKAILCDFDGTFVDKNNKYNPEVNKLLPKILAKNIRFSLSTGQPNYGWANKILQDLKIFDYHIFHGGALIMNNQNRKILWKQFISKDSAKKIVAYFLKNNLVFALEGADYAYFQKRIEIPSFVDQKHMNLISGLANFSSILKIVLLGSENKLPENKVDFHIGNLSKYCKDVALTKMFWKFYGLDITSEKATKHTAVLEYEHLLNIPREQIVAIGDGYNDYPLFTACGYKIAMENAPKELKEIADYIVPTVENNGTTIALQHVIDKFEV